MHREVMSAPEPLLVDHININSLDNRKANLRLATGMQNNWNTRKGFNKGTSKYKGVGWIKKTKKWRARFRCNHKAVHLGSFDDEKEAARAYNKAISELRGEFAVLNDV